MQRTLLCAIALATLTLMGCVRTDPISRSIAASVRRGPDARVVLADHAAFAWDRVCIFGPYTSDAEVDRISGIPGAAAHAFDIRENDGIDALLFTTGRQVVASVAHGRRGADFGPEVVDRCYSREQAVFSVRVPPPNSWGEIGPLLVNDRPFSRRISWRGPRLGEWTR